MMHGSNIAAALALLGQQLESALVGGHDTREIRRQMSELSQRERSAAAKAEAQERALRAAAEAEEQAEINGRATALLDEIKARIAETLAPLALDTAQTIRRYPDGEIEAVEITMEHDDA
jgi:flagellar biosynthesis/type III secretory pathway protein FliH